MNPLAKWLLIGGGILTLGGPALGVLGTVIGMMGSFNTLGKDGVASPESLASNIGVTLMSTAGGIVIGAIGVCVLVAGVIILIATKQKTTPPPLTE
jgi:biopolymer transport protein ExbB/TolQ